MPNDPAVVNMLEWLRGEIGVAKEQHTRDAIPPKQELTKLMLRFEPASVQVAAAPPAEPTSRWSTGSVAQVGQIECVNTSASSTVESPPSGGPTHSSPISSRPHQAQAGIRFPVS